jgi:chromosome segregation ATPase
MSGEPEKKGFFARINEALYETVETGEKEEAPDAGDAGNLGAEVGVAASQANQPLENAPELGARVRADIAGRGQALAQFLALASSFTEIIPEESGRYRAAMKALEKTGNITRKEVLRAANDQLRALGSQREVFAGTVGRKREELKALGGGVETIRAQIAELQQTIGRLQAEEQGALRNVAVEEGKIKAAEEGFSSLLSTLEAEVKTAQEKIEKYVPG